MGGKTLTKGIFEGEFRFDIFDDNFDYKKYLKLKNDYLSSKKKVLCFIPITAILVIHKIRANVEKMKKKFISKI